MILFKKSYAEQLLQLALTLSLLRVHPNNYLGWNWQSQLALNNGEGWQLELRPEPISDFPYSNRKALIPLMEDLVRFDRHRYTNPHDIQTYLLNVQNEQSNGGDSNQSSSQNNETSIQESRNQQEQFSLLNANELDFFLNSDHFADDTLSIAEQNAADLSDYGDLFAAFPYTGLKDEPPPIYGEIKIEPTTSYTSSDYGSTNNVTSDRSDSISMAVIDWSEFYDLKTNVKTEDITVGKRSNNGTEDIVKKEVDEDESQIDDKSDSLDEKNSTSGFSSNVELTEEESEIVEVLWKQDVDLGYSLAPPKPIDVKSSGVNADDENEKLRALQELKDEKVQEKEKEIDEWDGIQFTIDNETGEYIQLPLQLEEILQDALQLADLASDDQNDTFSAKVGESIISDNLSKDKDTGTSDATISDIDISADLSNINLDDASELEELEMMIQSSSPFQHSRSGQNYGHGANSFRQSYHQSRVPLSRNFSMEQRLQDIASLFNPIPGMGVGMGPADMASYSHYPSHYSYQSSAQIPQHGQFTHPHPHSHAVLHNASLAELGATQPHYGPNLGTAVSSSMHLTNSSHETDAGAAGYKIDHDNMMYYSNASSDINNQPTDVFINSLLSDEDMHLMDMGVNESFYTMRMLETNSSSNNSSVLGASNGGNNGLLPSSMQTNISTLGAMGSTGDRLDASSDSAVSSMGSERVPSLSDGEWGDAGSDSAQDFHQRNSSKYGGPYDYSYSSRLSDTSRHPVAQKKHQMYGKRYFQEQSSVPPLPQASTHQSDIPLKYEYEPYMHHGPALLHNIEGGAGPLVNKHQPSHMGQPEMKYSCSLDFVRQNRVNDLVNHNHTYTLPQGTGASPRPQARDKKQRRLDEEHLSRDEKRARALNIPMAVQEIINLPMDEFNERLSKYDLSETQLSLIRDIRRRGKNKVAAQNCRKRKLDQIICLADEVKEVRKRKDRLFRDRDMALSAHDNIKRKFAALHKHVFQNLRDPEGNPYSPTAYSLQQSADGSVFLLPKDNKDSRNNNTNQSNHQHHHHQKD